MERYERVYAGTGSIESDTAFASIKAVMDTTERLACDASADLTPLSEDFERLALEVFDWRSTRGLSGDAAVVRLRPDSV